MPYDISVPYWSTTFYFSVLGFIIIMSCYWEEIVLWLFITVNHKYLTRLFKGMSYVMGVG